MRTDCDRIARWRRRAVGLALLTTGCVGVADDDDDDGGASAASEADAEHSAVSVDPADRCDLGFNTITFNETTELTDHVHDDHTAMTSAHAADYTIEEWAEVFADEAMGFTPESLAQFVHDSPQMTAAVTGGGLTETLDPDPWMPMTDPAECTALADELRRTRRAIALYPTVADAEAAGYFAGSDAAPGQGAHYTRVDYMFGAFDPAKPAQLMFDGMEPTSTLIGMAHLVVDADGTVPAGFTGDNDHWHKHQNLCQNAAGVAIGGDMTPEECAAIGGTFADLPAEGLWMLHTWVVPGCEDDWGLFANANPRFPERPPGVPFAPGCNSGRTVDQPLELDHPGNGPTIDG